MTKPSKNIVFIGMRGTGKSAIGRTLATYLDWQFVDVDQLLEASEDRQISQIVAESGWEHFRDLESKYTARAASQKNSVIATGGGVVLRPENIETLKKTGVLVYLTAPLSHMVRRVAGGGHRPSLTGADPAVELKKVWEDRRVFYENAADVTLDVGLETQNKKTDLTRKSKLALMAVRDFLQSV